MKFLLSMMAVFALLALGLYGYARSLPAEWRVERSVELEAPPRTVLAYLSVPRNWPEWTVWNAQSYPQMRFSYAGPAWGVGALQEWEDERAAGRLEITGFEPEQRLDYRLEMRGTGGTFGMSGSLRAEPVGEGSRLIWSAGGRAGENPLDRLGMRVLQFLLERQFGDSLERLQRRYAAG